MINALITGASRGIGKAVALKLAAMGFHVIVNYNSNKDKAQEVVESILNSGGSAEALRFNVANADEVNKVLDAWKKANAEKTIQILVNNAGITNDSLMVFMDNENWENVINTNLNGFFHVTSQLLKEMVLSKYGRIINIVSLSGLKGTPGQTNYSASKGGIIAATKALAQELAKKKITVNAVAPGFIKSDMTVGLPESELKKMIPANRFGTPEEVAELVGFLASENSSYITGEVININGGLYS
ncbi:3-oxoacyl-ACP reductase FabG [Maribellus mangrovi]|uniref:3-oxoacyl-ACP reductase FabG n=1 Tax=Maribellus mangrovi TaxID=3133146 RepID=UPI0030EE1FEC